MEVAGGRGEGETCGFAEGGGSQGGRASTAPGRMRDAHLAVVIPAWGLRPRIQPRAARKYGPDTTVSETRGRAILGASRPTDSRLSSCVGAAHVWVQHNAHVFLPHGGAASLGSSTEQHPAKLAELWP